MLVHTKFHVSSILCEVTNTNDREFAWLEPLYWKRWSGENPDIASVKLLLEAGAFESRDEKNSLT